MQENPTAPVAVAATVPVTRTRTPKVKKPVSKMPKPVLHVKNIGGKKSQGNRQSRRHENSQLQISIHVSIISIFVILVCFLLNLARDLDEDFAEININDLVETTISAFAQLLLNKNKMKVSAFDSINMFAVYPCFFYTLQFICPLTRGPL